MYVEILTDLCLCRTRSSTHTTMAHTHRPVKIPLNSTFPDVAPSSVCTRGLISPESVTITHLSAAPVSFNRMRKSKRENTQNKTWPFLESQILWASLLITFYRRLKRCEYRGVSSPPVRIRPVFSRLPGFQKHIVL